MRISLILATLLLGAAPAPLEKPKEESGPMEIDFSPVPTTGEGKYKIHIVAETMAGAKYKDTCTADRGITASQLRFLVQESFKSADWKVQSPDAPRLIVEGYKGSPLKSMELKTEGLTKEQTPTVKRVTPKDK